jgi:hypothetical protein
MSVKIVNRDSVTEKQMEESVADFTHGVLHMMERVGAKSDLKHGGVSLDFDGVGVLVSKRGSILTLQKVDPEEREALFPLYKYDLEDDELIFFDTEEERYGEPCFEVYAEIQMWDYQISSGL